MKNRNRLIIAAILLWFSPTICDAIYRPVGIIKTLIINSMATVFSSTYDISTPAGSDSPSEADDRMRETKAAVQERSNVDHYWPLTGTEVSDTSAGEHRKMTFQASISDPSQVSGKAHFYMQSDELRYQDDTNAAFDLTSAGSLGSTSTELLAKNVVVSSAADTAGEFESTDPTVRIKLYDSNTTGGLESVLRRAGDVLTFCNAGGDVRLGTSTAGSTANARQVADKGYVDAQIAANLHSFGSWTSATQGSSTLAATDGIIQVLVDEDIDPGDSVSIKTNATNPPTVVRAAFEGFSATVAGRMSISCPVVKGEYYLIEDTGLTPTAYFLPVGL